MANKEESGIYFEYFKISKEYQDKYGKHTVLLMQVGSFFEIYGLKDNEGSSSAHSTEINEVAQFCQFTVSEKKMIYKNSQVLMAGFPDYKLEKYLQKITENMYTAVVFVQEKNEKNTKRIFHGVYSPGTYLSYESENSTQITNNVMCIWFELFKPLHKDNRINNRHKENLVCGISVANILTGKSYMFEYTTAFYMNPTTFDELERAISMFHPSEVIVISPFENEIVRTIANYSGINTTVVHYGDSNDLSCERVQNCTKQKYINHILSTFYGDESYQICSEFNTHAVATQSFCYLLNFIHEHNPNLVKNIAIPVFNNTSDRMVLANHTLKQLNIMDDNTNDGKNVGQLSSVLTFLNRCCSPMGKRLFRYQLLNPTFNEEWLEKEYCMTEIMRKPDNYIIVSSIRKLLMQVKDVEKTIRQIVLQKIYPSSIYYLFKSITIMQYIMVYCTEIPEIMDYLCSDYRGSQTHPVAELPSELVVESGVHRTPTLECEALREKLRFSDQNLHIDNQKYNEEMSKEFIKFIKAHLHIDLCKTIQSTNSFDDNIICTGISETLDGYIAKSQENNRIFKAIREQLNRLMQKHENNNDTDYVKEHETEKSGFSLQITKKRATTLKKILSQISEPIVITPEISLVPKDIKFSNATTACDEIEYPLLNKICKELLQLKDKINKEIASAYQDFVRKLEKDWLPVLENMASFLGKIDVLQCKTYISKEYNYCRPTIDKTSSVASLPLHKECSEKLVVGGYKEHKPPDKSVHNDDKNNNNNKSFASAKDLRHVLIEQLQQNEIYVPNDIDIGTQEQDGILLYGTNAVGKTSIIRALGIAIVMAQTGLYVPCSQFVYKPYRAIFSRILANDNLFKSMSTFAVEMSELRIILKMANEYSLILGDEVCSGTETESALSIFVTALQELHDKQSSFIFATHFHEIATYDEITSLSKMSMKYMSVYYDRELECLVYDRKLKKGSGNRMYGLEVCKSLYMPEDFLEKAYRIRQKYFPDTKGVLSETTSRYNAGKIKGMCEICKEQLGEDVHHLREQVEANDDGFIEGFHKNHPANLINICKKCHILEHKQEKEQEHKDVIKIKKSKIKTMKGFKVI